LKRARDAAPGIQTYSDYQVMLRETKPDLVSIALPNSLHLLDALYASAEAGREMDVRRFAPEAFAQL